MLDVCELDAKQFAVVRVSARAAQMMAGLFPQTQTPHLTQYQQGIYAVQDAG